MTALFHVYDELHAILHSLVAGSKYGFRIRVPHALVMTLLFKSDLSAERKLRTILKLALEHATNLAAFAAVYKSILALLKWTHRHLLVTQQQQYTSAGGSGSSSATWSITMKEGLFRWLGRVLLAAFVDGPLIPGEGALVRATGSAPGHPERSHHALVAGAVGGYLVWGRYSSVNYQIVLYITSRVLAGLCKRHVRLPGALQRRGYPLVAAVVWGLVMLLFEEDPDVLHPSLRTSMEEIYRIRDGNKSSDNRRTLQQQSGNESVER